MLLSSLEQIQFQSVELEQYSTNGDLAARWLTDISTFGDLHESCSVADLGAGNGVLGLGAIALGAGRTTLIEVDQTACDIASKNADKLGFADLVEVTQQPSSSVVQFDTSCFNGEYITGDISPDYLQKLEDARNDAAKGRAHVDDAVIDLHNDDG